MKTRGFQRRLTAAGALLVAVGAAVPSLGQDCRLAVSAIDPVLMPGESTPIHVWGHFPPSAFAFASAEFIVRAGMPGWSAVSAGAVAGAEVLGIMANQSHMPQMGVLADPANPLRIWSGVFTPDSYNPAFTQVRATPSAFAYYPSELTSSSVACDADPGRSWVLVNPVPIGPAAAAAPGEGTAMETVGDDLVIGRDDDEAILIGLLLPAVQKVRIGTPEPVDNLTIETRIEPERDDLPIESLSLNFAKVEDGYEVRGDLPMALSGETCHWNGRIFICIIWLTDGPLPYRLPRIPDTYRTRVEAGPNGDTVVAELGYDAPILVGPPGTPPVETTTVQVRMRCQNNLKQIGLALHSYEALGTPELGLTLVPVCAADANGDGDVNSGDISAFLTGWLASVSAGTLDADFNGDEQVNSGDINAFLTAWLDAVPHGC